MELEPWGRSARGLREHVRQVAGALGHADEAYTVQTDEPVSAYLPLDQYFYGFPDRDAALFWHPVRGWYAVVSSETVTFRKSLNLWQRFDVESRLIGHDDKAIYLEHRAVVDGEVYARAIIRARMMKRSGGTLSHEELFTAVGRPEGIPEVEDWVHEWAAASALPPTRAEAPSIWN